MLPSAGLWSEIRLGHPSQLLSGGEPGGAYPGAPDRNTPANDHTHVNSCCLRFQYPFKSSYDQLNVRRKYTRHKRPVSMTPDRDPGGRLCNQILSGPFDLGVCAAGVGLVRFTVDATMHARVHDVFFFLGLTDYRWEASKALTLSGSMIPACLVKDRGVKFGESVKRPKSPSDWMPIKMCTIKAYGTSLKEYIPLRNSLSHSV